MLFFIVWQISFFLFSDFDMPFSRWDSDRVASWLHHIGLSMYVGECKRWIRNGDQLQRASLHDYEKVDNLTIIWQKTEPGSLGHWKCLCANSSLVSWTILTRLGMVKVLGLESNLAKSEFWNSRRLPWKLGSLKLRTEPGGLRHFWRRSQAASDIFEDGARRPQTFLKTEPGGLGHFVGRSQAASDIL